MINDFTVIGCGIVGLATAFQLRKDHPDARILMIEKEEGPARHQTGNNSGVLHSGIYYTPGSLKALNCIKGYGKMLDFCNKHEIHYEICGKIIVATDAPELPALERIYNNGVNNGLQGLEWLDERGISDREPHISGIKAILVPQAGIVDYGQVANKLQEILRGSGVKFEYGRIVTGIQEYDNEVQVTASERVFRTGQLITCGGLHADRLAKMTGARLDCRIVPFRGEYYRLRSDKKHLVNHLVYPVPDPAFPFLGVHFTPTIHGEVEAGPNAVLAFSREGYRFGQVNLRDLFGALTYPGFLKLAGRHWKKGMEEMHRSLSKAAFMRSLRQMMPELIDGDMERSGAGVRAQALRRDGSLVDDFYFERSDRVLHVINAPSPAATASLAIGEQIASQLADR